MKTAVHLLRCRPGGRAAFTLTEALIALAIIGSLAALLMPVLSRAREQSAMVGCLGNLRSLGVAFQAFANDNNGCLPQDEAPKPNNPGSIGGWPYQVTAYLACQYGTFASAPPEKVKQSAFHCPAEREVVRPWICYSINKELNQRLYGEKALIRQTELAAASRYVVLADSHSSFYIPTDSKRKMVEWAFLTRRHGGHPNFLYADWHAAPFTREIVGLGDAGGGDPFYKALWQARYRP